MAKKYSNQAEEYYKKGQYKQALLFTQKADNLKKKALGKKQPNSLSPEQNKQLTLYMNQAIKYQQKGDFKQALPFYEKSYHLSQEVLGTKDYVTLTSLNGLALCEYNEW